MARCFGHNTRAGPSQSQDRGSSQVNASVAVCGVGKVDADRVVGLLEVQLGASSLSAAQPVGRGTENRPALGTGPLRFGRFREVLEESFVPGPDEVRPDTDRPDLLLDFLWDADSAPVPKKREEVSEGFLANMNRVLEHGKEARSRHGGTEPKNIQLVDDARGIASEGANLAGTPAISPSRA